MNVETIIQGGAVGLCVLLIISHYYERKQSNKTMQNHLNHVNDTLNSLIVVIRLLDRTIRKKK